jgi:hypothetical protein
MGVGSEDWPVEGEIGEAAAKGRDGGFSSKLA